MLPTQWSDNIGQWASGHPQIVSIYAFGSRVTGLSRQGGGVRPDSDLDLAIAVQGHSASNALSEFFSYRKQWADEIGLLLNIVVEINYLGPEAGHVMRYVREGGQHIYGNKLQALT